MDGVSSSRFATIEDRPLGGVFEAALLPDEEKERLCRALLAEFGVNSIQTTPAGEMVHSCCLPFGGHRDGDRHPSARLNYRKLTYKCWSCGSGGGLLWLISACRGIDTDDARAWLNGETGLGGAVQELPALLAYFDAVYSPERDLPQPIPYMDERIINAWLFVHPYLTEVRHVPEENAVALKVGFGRFEIKLPSGTAISSERIVFPHFWDGALCGWQTRRLFDDGTPKYHNTSPDFPKDRTIYNYDARRDCVMVESPMSTVRHLHHVPNMEATFSASVTPRQCRLIAEHRGRKVLWFDNDDAGWKATQTVGEFCAPYDEPWVVESPWAADPGDLPDDEVDRLLAGAVPYSLWKPPVELRPWGDA